MTNYDVIVVGLGGMGSSAAYHLSKMGLKVLGLEQFNQGHALGSSHGKTRLIRKAYFEHPDYVPLLHESYNLWREIEKESQESLLHLSGLTIFGSPESQILQGVKNSKEKFGLNVIEHSESEAQKLNTFFKVPTGFIGLEEPEAGFLEVEKCVNAHLKIAKRQGAELRFNEPCLSWGADNQTIWVKTDREKISAKHLVITAGPWTSQVLKDINVKLQVHRVTQFWFKAKAQSTLNSLKNCFAFDMPYGFMYGFPKFDNSDLLKVAIHKPGAKISDLSQVEREITATDYEEVSQFIAEVLPGVDPIPVEGSVCLYTMTADEHFIIDHHPSFERVVFAGGFSGHGFKFASVIGKILSDLVSHGKSLNLPGFLKVRPAVID